MSDTRRSYTTVPLPLREVEGGGMMGGYISIPDDMTDEDVRAALDRLSAGLKSPSFREQFPQAIVYEREVLMVEQPPLTDAELDEIESHHRAILAHRARPGEDESDDALRLVAEVRRWRSHTFVHAGDPALIALGAGETQGRNDERARVVGILRARLARPLPPGIARVLTEILDQVDIPQ